MIETCYLERQIFDELYREFEMSYDGTATPSQDEGHKHRLKLTKEDFKTCFPNIETIISIKYDQHMPVTITITKTRNGIFSSSETYTKTIIYDPFYGTKRYDKLRFYVKKKLQNINILRCRLLKIPQSGIKIIFLNRKTNVFLFYLYLNHFPSHYNIQKEQVKHPHS